MTREEVKSLVDKIQVYRQSFLITNNVYQEWNRILEPYDYGDVDNKLNDFFQDGDNYGKYPDAYQLVKRLTKTIDKLKNNGMLISCKNCGRFLPMEKYDAHFDKCNSVEYLVRNYKKYYNKNLSLSKIWKLPDDKFWKMYWKFNEQIIPLVTEEKEKNMLLKAIDEHVKSKERRT